MNDLDPAAIMAEHHGEPDEWCYGDDDRPQMWPCDTYRLAAALVEANERLDMAFDDRDEQTGLADRYWRESGEAIKERDSARAALVEAQEREQRVRAVLASANVIGISRREIREALDGKP